MTEKMENPNPSQIKIRHSPENYTTNLSSYIGWNCRSLNMNKILFSNYLIEKYKPEWVIIWETWLNKDPTGIDRRYDIFRTQDANHQGVWILAKKNTVLKSYVNEEPYIIAIELINKTFIIGVYMKEDSKYLILEQLKNLINRIRRKYKTPKIIVFGDFNTNQNWRIKQIEIATNLRWSKLNKTLITRRAKINEERRESTLDYFLTSVIIKSIETTEEGDSDHLPIIANIYFHKTNWVKIKDYILKTDYKNSEENIKALLSSKWPEENGQNSNIFKNKIKIRPVIKMQSSANEIIKQNNNWNERNIKLNDIRKNGFINYMKNLNIYWRQDKRSFYNILNSVIKYIMRGKIIKGIKADDTILYGKEKDKFIKNYYERLFYKEEHNHTDHYNGIFEFHCDIVRAIETLSRSNAAGIDGIPSKIYRQSFDNPIIM